MLGLIQPSTACFNTMSTRDEEMSELIIITAKLTGYRKRAKPVPSFATAYQFEPEPSLDRELGSLLAVVEVLANPKQAEAVADLIIQTVGDKYYNQAPTPSNDETSPYQRFERAIKAVNHELTAYADRGNAGWVGRLSAVLAVQCGSELHISQAGSANGYLYRHGQAVNITAEMSVLGPHRPQASFSSIASGQLQSEDRLLLGTPALFHQIDRASLSQIIGQNSPESAVLKLSELINLSPHADRVAALVVEVTTPDLLASRRGGNVEGTGDIKVGQPDNFIASAKEATTPLLKRSLSLAQTAGLAALHHSKKTVIPQVGAIASKGATSLGQAIRHPKKQRWLLLGAAVIAAGAIWLSYSSLSAKAINRLVSRYDTDYQQIEASKQKLSAGSKTEARQTLSEASGDLDQLSKLPQARLIDGRLSHRSHPEDDPASITQLRLQAAGLIDQIDGLITVSPQNITSFDQPGGLKPTSLQYVGSKIVLIDSSSGSVGIFDLATNQLSPPQTDKSLGKIVDSVTSSNNDGVYLLTSEPSVWFYKFDGTLSRQATSFGAWPKARSIASYTGNLYLLADDSSQIYKHTRNLGGFSGKTSYLSADSAPAISSASAIAVDGSVYVSGPFGLKRFIAGKLDQTATLPASLTHTTSLESVSDGDLILLADQTSGRLGLVSASGNQLSFLKQVTLTGQAKITAAASDPGGKTIYALTGSKLVKFALPK